MGSARPVLAALGISLGLHLAAGWSIGHPHPWTQTLGAHSEPIDISYAMTAPKPAVQAPVEKAPAAPPKKKIPSIPIPRQPALKTASSAPVKASSAPKASVARYTAEKPAPAASGAAVKSTPRTTAELLSDPQTGKLFVRYFSDVKKKIQQTLVERYAHRYSGTGGVELLFVLTPEGRVQKVSVMPRGTEAEAALQDMAVQCLRLAAPFGPFPSQLGTRPIAFNVTIYFDGK